MTRRIKNQQTQFQFYLSQKTLSLAQKMIYTSGTMLTVSRQLKKKDTVELRKSYTDEFS